MKRFQEKTGLRAINKCIVERSHSAVHSALKSLQEQLVFSITGTFTQDLSLFCGALSLLLNSCAYMRKFTVKKNNTLGVVLQILLFYELFTGSYGSSGSRETLFM
jgi:hypothetical protein